MLRDNLEVLQFGADKLRSIYIVCKHLTDLILDPEWVMCSSAKQTLMMFSFYFVKKKNPLWNVSEPTFHSVI